MKRQKIIPIMNLNYNIECIKNYKLIYKDKRCIRFIFTFIIY